MKARTFLAAGLLFLAAMVPSLPIAQADTGDSSAKNRLFELPRALGAGDDKEVSVLLDASQLKLAVVTLRRGTALPPHSTPVPATVQVLEGEGLIHVGGESMAVTQGSLVLLAAGAEHDVVPTPGSDMILLVHYLRGAPGTAPAHHAEHDH